MLMLTGRLMVASHSLTHARLLAGLLLASALGACGGGSGEAAVAPPTASVAPPIKTPSWTGHFVGTVKSARGSFFGDALLTADGSMRLYVGGTYAETGALQLTRPPESEQFVGSLTVSDAHAQASGVVIGQQCATGTQSPYCGHETPADLSMSLVAGSGAADKIIEGQMQVATAAGSETWTLDLGHWPDGVSAVGGQFRELLAEFASANDTVIVVDGNGTLFFQSPHSGCTGNGTIVVRSGDEAYAADVSVTIGNCAGAFAYLNGEYSGLATATPSSIWNYDGLLRMWLSKAAGTSPPAALTMLSDPM